MTKGVYQNYQPDKINPYKFNLTSLSQLNTSA